MHPFFFTVKELYTNMTISSNMVNIVNTDFGAKID